MEQQSNTSYRAPPVTQLDFFVFTSTYHIIHTHIYLDLYSAKKLTMTTANTIALICVGQSPKQQIVNKYFRNCVSPPFHFVGWSLDG